MQLKAVSKKEARQKLTRHGMKFETIDNLISKSAGKQIKFGIDSDNKFSICTVGTKAGSSKRCRYGQSEEKVRKTGKKAKIFEDDHNEDRAFSIAFARVFQK